MAGRSPPSPVLLVPSIVMILALLPCPAAFFHRSFHHHPHHTHRRTARHEPPTENTATPATDFIVQFSKYQRLQSHMDTVRHHIQHRSDKRYVECADHNDAGPPNLHNPPPPATCHWRFKKRSAQAAKYPTDFVVLTIHEVSVAPSMRRAIEAMDGVRRVHNEQAMTRTIQSVPVGADGGGDGRFSWRALLARAEGNGTAAAAAAAAVESRYGPFLAHEVWARGFTGAGVRVAVFDTGINLDSPYFQEEIERTNWTDEKDEFDDKVGHGTFVASLIAGVQPSCPGIAPHAQIVTFRVFTGTQISYTSWFLDAFNYALYSDIDILNLSIGGPDASDEPFMEKVNELTSAGIIVVSAIGNDGPLYGSLNNPADMAEVIGVGGLEPNGAVATFSSRGMTTHELDLPFPSYGRVKPDIVAYSRSLSAASNRRGGTCAKLSGTSVASPVVAAAVALMASTVPRERRREVVNPASVKRALLMSSMRVEAANMYEQGAGLLDIPRAVEAIRELDEEYLRVEAAKERTRTKSDNSTALVPGRKISFFPSYLDFAPEGCPYMWPFCAQPLYHGGVTTTINVTVFNSAGVKARLVSTEWLAGSGGDNLEVTITPPSRFWPWAAGLGVHIRVKRNVPTPFLTYGILRVTVESIFERTRSVEDLPIRTMVIPTPPREKRLLWDMFHNVRYPPAYVPRDSLADTKDMLDWLGDHPHTNFHELFRSLISGGFFVETWSQPLTCLPTNALSQYGSLLLIDTEDFFFQDEIDVVEKAVLHNGLNVVVAAEWYNPDVMDSVGFMDDNTRSFWKAIIAGGNSPALNALLSRFNMAVSESVVSGDVALDSVRFPYMSGTTICRAPAGSEIIVGRGFRHYRLRNSRSDREEDVVVLARARPTSSSGSVLVYGDTYCLDTAGPALSEVKSSARCYEFFVHALKSLSEGSRLGRSSQILVQPLDKHTPSSQQLPPRVLSMFRIHSKVLDTEPNKSVSSSTSLCYGRAAGVLSPPEATADFSEFAMPHFQGAKHQGYYPGVTTPPAPSYSFMMARPSPTKLTVLLCLSIGIVGIISRNLFRSQRRKHRKRYATPRNCGPT